MDNMNKLSMNQINDMWTGNGNTKEDKGNTEKKNMCKYYIICNYYQGNSRKCNYDDDIKCGKFKMIQELGL
jgi:hypothetical protein